MHGLKDVADHTLADENSTEVQKLVSSSENSTPAKSLTGLVGSQTQHHDHQSERSEQKV